MAHNQNTGQKRTEKLNYRRLLRRSFLGLLSLLLLYIISVLLYGTFTDYQPEDRIELEHIKSVDQVVDPDSSLSFTIWNLGFGGLGKESDFFYDNGHFFFSGGKKTRTPQPLVEKNVKGILEVIDTLQSDFFLLQEVDRPSRRSHYFDQFGAIGDLLPRHASTFATNFNVDFVPIPVLEPWRAYGKANSGLASFTRFQPKESIRIQLPGEFSWPKRVFSLDRCLNLQRFDLPNGKSLVVVNVHNSAYDKNGALKNQQLDFIKELLVQEYEKGNYVIAGGDWNMCPPYFRFDGFMPGRTQGYTQMNIPDDLFPPNWRWVYDATLPSNRKTKTTYLPGQTFVTVIDFYLVSPNIQVKKVRAVNTDFAYSDHQPVWVEVELR